MATHSQALNLTGVLSESKRIINAHSRHFLALSVIFLLPIAFSLNIYPTLQFTLSHQPNFTNTRILLRLLPDPESPDLDLPAKSKTLIIPIVFTLFIAFLSICAIGTITYSTYHGFYGRPVKIGSAIKSLLGSFLPLVCTGVVSLIIAGVIVFVFGFGLFFMLKGASFLGFNVENGSYCYNWLNLIVVVGLVLVLVAFQVHCGLAYVIVVVESKWGFTSLWRSMKLVKGMRLVSMYLVILVCIAVVFPLGSSFAPPLVNLSGGFDLLKSAGFIVLTVTNSSFVTLFMLFSLSAHTVLYMYCKALHGELAFEIAEEFAREYVSLPFDDDKVPHIVTVV